MRGGVTNEGSKKKDGKKDIGNATETGVYSCAKLSLQTG